ncbi:MAG TPA: alkaline phosphatase [Myxococcota bacterium]|nr:alkaline phosphatase [Myxococcota bacterium]
MKRTCAALAVAVGVGATAWSGVARADEDWQAAGRRTVAEARALAPSARDAKNAVLFVGDGMGIATVTAARILDGQQRGQSGEENLLAFERLPYVALSKTYNTNQQVPESSGTMTAMVTGSKTTAGVLSIDSSVPVGDHRAVKGHELETLFERAEARGYATGIVTTTTITHATPGACYAHVPDRDWESDARLSDAARADGFPDIARQLVEFRAGDGLDVAFGGGRAFFLPTAAQDPEYAEQRGERRDDRDLTAEWVAKGPQRRFVWNRSGFTDLDAKTSPQVLGLFEPSHLKFEVLRASDPGGEPSLAEMTAKAIELLRGRGRGFVLMVEGGRIDHGHHAGSAYLALNEAVSFSRAVEAGLARVDLADTLVVVTADHSHTLTMAGYPQRGNPILGLAVGTDEHGKPGTQPTLDLAGRPYTTLGYANGPGHPGETDQQPAGPKRFPHRPKKASGAATTRPDLREVDTQAPTYLQESAVPLESETHGGEDVAIYAGGPGAQLFHGVQEQSYVYHAIAAALGWDPPRNAPAAGD